MKKVFLLFVVMLLSITMNAQGSREDRAVYRDLMETFCSKYFESCFSGRKYVLESITVRSIEEVSSKPNTVRVRGRYSYAGYLGNNYTKEYYADISLESNEEFIRIVFNKESVDMWGATYWEDCTKRIGLKDLD
jgi:hypothetical protein